MLCAQDTADDRQVFRQALTLRAVSSVFRLAVQNNERFKRLWAKQLVLKFLNYAMTIPSKHLEISVKTKREWHFQIVRIGNYWMERMQPILSFERKLKSRSRKELLQKLKAECEQRWNDSNVKLKISHGELQTYPPFLDSNFAPCFVLTGYDAMDTGTHKECIVWETSFRLWDLELLFYTDQAKADLFVGNQVQNRFQKTKKHCTIQ